MCNLLSIGFDLFLGINQLTQIIICKYLKKQYFPIIVYKKLFCNVGYLFLIQHLLFSSAFQK